MVVSDDKVRCKRCRGVIRPGYRHDQEGRMCYERNDSPALPGNWMDPTKPHFENEVNR